MSPGSTNLDDLARQLQKQKDDAEHRLLREIQQFSHRFRLAGLVMTLFFLMLGFIFYMLAWRWPHPILLYLAWAPLILAWLYWLLLPLLFVMRTTLLAYVLEKHWVWLALVIAAPIDLYFMPAPGPLSTSNILGRIPVVFFIFLLWGWIRRRARREVFLQEVRKNASLWQRLIPLGALDIALLGFWNIRPPRPNPRDG